MATEIERKFLVNGDGWRDSVARSSTIRQAYLSQTGTTTIRIRIIDDATASLTIKSPEPGPVRSEFEYSIPVDDARALLAARVGILIEKQRHIVEAGNLRWEIDVFEGAHAGLVIAEIELPDASTTFERPSWIGAEVTGDPRYYNAQLAAGHQP